MSKNMPADALSGPYAQQQKMLLYVLPVVFAVGGIAFPIGVLLYWTTSNLWTMGQQFYVIRNNPAPGTPAAKAKADARRGRRPRATATASVGRDRARRPRPPRPATRPAADAAAAAQEAVPRSSARSPADARRSHGHRATSTAEGAAAVSEPTSETERRDDRRPTRATRSPTADGDASTSRRRRRPTDASGEASTRRPPPTGSQRLEQEGDIAADYLEELLDIADLDGDLDMDVEGDRAAVSIVGADLSQLVGRNGEVLDALQELTRLAVYRETGERSRLMLDIVGLPRRQARGAGEAGRGDGRRGPRDRRARSPWTR